MQSTNAPMNLEGVNPPESEKHGVRQRPVQVLHFANERVVVFFRGRPQEQSRVHHEVLVDSHLIGDEDARGFKKRQVCTQFMKTSDFDKNFCCTMRKLL